MDFAAHKESILSHVLRIAEVDPEYATWAAGWYESNQPDLLKNLQAKVQQSIKRRLSTSGKSSRVEGSADAK